MTEILQNVRQKREEIKRYFEMTKLWAEYIQDVKVLQQIELLEKNVLGCLGE